MTEGDLVEREWCAGVPLVAADMDQAVELIVDAEDERGRSVHFCNAYTLSLAHGNDSYRQLLRRSTLCFPDGQSVVWARRLLSRQAGLRRLSGPDVFERVFAASTTQGPRHFLLGGDDQTLALLLKRLTERFPEAQIVGHESPPFRSMSHEERLAQDARIRASNAQIVWVGLGTPKQDHEVQRLANSLPVTAVAVGAAFDFIAGTKKRAPRWMRPLGLEWIHRLASEPRRLWKRYLIGNTVFVWAAWRRRGESNGS